MLQYKKKTNGDLGSSSKLRVGSEIVSIPLNLFTSLLLFSPHSCISNRAIAIVTPHSSLESKPKTEYYNESIFLKKSNWGIQKKSYHLSKALPSAARRTAWTLLRILAINALDLSKSSSIFLCFWQRQRLKLFF